jgi:hypothetical protein
MVMMAGIASQRIVLPINNVAQANHSHYVGNTWTMASCPRRDVQCIYAPTSPCVLTMDQIYSGTLLPTKQDFFDLFHTVGAPTPNTTTAYDNMNMNDTVGPYTPPPQVLWQSYKNFGRGLNNATQSEVFFHRVYELAQQLNSWPSCPW